MPVWECQLFTDYWLIWKKETQVQCENCNKAGRGLRICLFVYAKPPKGSLSVPRYDMWNLLMSFAIFLVFIFTSAILRIIFQMQAFFCLKVEIWQKKVRYHAKKKDVVLTGHCIRHTNRRKYIKFIINQTKIIYFLIGKAKKYSDCKITRPSGKLFPGFFSTESIPPCK